MTQCISDATTGEVYTLTRATLVLIDRQKGRAAPVPEKIIQEVQKQRQQEPYGLLSLSQKHEPSFSFTQMVASILLNQSQRETIRIMNSKIFRQQRRVSPTDIDVWAHVNQAMYVSYIEDVLHCSGVLTPSLKVSALHVNYRQQTFVDTNLEVSLLYVSPKI